MGAVSVVMLSALHVPEDRARYTMVELLELRRTMLRFARFFARGTTKRKQKLQIAVSLGRLFKNKAWLDAHT
jgi:hypothetical protein